MLQIFNLILEVNFIFNFGFNATNLIDYYFSFQY